MAYFDNASTTLKKPKGVLEAVSDAMESANVNYGRGSHRLSSEIYSLVDETRELVQEVMGCISKEVIFTPTATESLNILIRGCHIESAANKTSPLCSGDTVYISPFEHNAVTRTLEHLKITRGINVEVLTDEDLENGNATERFNTKRPNMLILCHVSNVTGEVLPVKDLCSLAKKANPNCVCLVDMAQSAGKAIAKTIAGLEAIDAVVFSGHKSLYAPFGASGMLIKPNLEIDPLIFGGTGFESAKQQMPTDIPERFEVGSVNTPALIGLRTACSWRIKNYEEIEIREKENSAKLLSIIEEFPLNIHYGLKNNMDDNLGIFSCLPKNGKGAEWLARQLDEKNIQVRSGLHCAPYAHKVISTYPSGTVRLSSSYFNDDEDFDELSDALTEVLAC